MRKALIIGIDDYPDCPLDGCINDANNLNAVLERNGNGSVNFAVKLVTPDRTVKKSEIKQLISELFQGDSEVALLYFSGHGALTETGGYIVTPDYKTFDEGISMNEILTYANKSGARNKLIILDCCHSGSFGEVPNAEAISNIGNGVTILAASRNWEAAIEIDGDGVFTTLLIEALEGGAADIRGNITPGSIYAYVDQALGAWDQRPVFKTNISRFVQVRTVEPLIPLEVIREIPNYFPDSKDELPLDKSFEPTEKEYAKDENVKIFKHLQKMVSVGLVKPVDEEHMYFAAMNGKSCKLTSLGHQYHKMVTEKLI